MYKKIEEDDRYITYEIGFGIEEFISFIKYVEKEYEVEYVLLEDIGRKADFSRKGIGWGVIDKKDYSLVLQGEI